MEKITIVVRKTGSLEPDHSLNFEVPSLPRVGNYLSIHRDDAPRPFGEDLIVRQVWWRMEYPAVNDDRSGASVGKLRRSLSNAPKPSGPTRANGGKRNCCKPSNSAPRSRSSRYRAPARRSALSRSSSSVVEREVAVLRLAPVEGCVGLPGEISRVVNSVKNDTPECVEPIGQQPSAS
jgi:hypothetical protein